MPNRVRAAIVALATSYHLAGYAQESPESDKASPEFAAIALVLMVVLVVAPLVWWWMRERGEKKDRKKDD